MQTNNIFFNQVSAASKPETTRSKPKEQSKNSKGFSDALKEANSSTKEEKTQSQGNQVSQENNKVDSRGGRGERQPGKENLEQNNAESQKTEEVKDTPTEPQDIVELTQLFNGIPIVVVTPAGERQPTVNIDNQNSQLDFSTVLLSANENSLDQVADAQGNNVQNAKNGQFTQLMQDNLASGEDTLQPQNILSSDLKIGNQEDKNTSLPNSLLENMKQQTNQQGVIQQQSVGNQTISNQHSEVGELTIQPTVATNDNSVMAQKQSETVAENASQDKQDSIKDFWQNLKGKLEVKETRGPIITTPNNQPEQQNEDSAGKSDFAQMIIPTTNNHSNLEATTAVHKFSDSMSTSENDEVMKQVIQKIQVNLKPGQTEMRMQLKPEHLGELQMKLVVEDGKVTAQFLTNNNNVKESLEANLHQLRQSLQDQGIRVEKLSVLVGGGNLHFNQGRKEEGFTNNQRLPKNWRKINTEGYTESAIEAITEVEKRVVSANGVDYMA